VQKVRKQLKLTELRLKRKHKHRRSQVHQQQSLVQVQVRVQVRKETQEVRNHQEVEKVAVEALKVVEVLKAEAEPVEVRNLQEVPKEEDHLKEELLREEQKPTGVDQGEGAILGVSLISQYLQIRI
jgi:uncharacterized protein YegJ (DUF2314 family)